MASPGDPKHPLFEYLARKDLVPGKAADRVRRWSGKTLVGFLTEAEEIVRNSWQARPSNFSFIANSPLSGGVRPCGDPECRVIHADRLGRFAILFGDQVTIQNPLQEPRFVPATLDWGRRTAYGSLLVLWHLQPLIEAGLVAIANPAVSFCEKHLPDIVKSGTLALIGAELMRQFDAQLTITAVGREEFSISGPESILEHHVTVFAGDRPRGVSSTSHISSRVTTKKREKLIRGIVNPILRDLVHQVVLGEPHHMRYLTDRDVDFIGLQKATEKGRQEFSQAPQRACRTRCRFSSSYP